MACGAWDCLASAFNAPMWSGGRRCHGACPQPILVRQLLMFGAGDFIDSLNDDVGGLIRRIIRRDRSTISGDRFSLGDHVKRAAFSDKHIDSHERLEPGTKA